jgi:hypothetical protein
MPKLTTCRCFRDLRSSRSAQGGRRAALSFLLASCLFVGCPRSESATVHGIVVSTSDGGPVAGAVVAIPGAGSTTTARDGTFTLTQHTVPYDIGVGIPGSSKAIFFESVRSTTLRLPFPFPLWTDVAAAVSGSITGGEGYPQPAYHETLVCLDTDTNWQGGPGTPTTGSGTFSTVVFWPGRDAIPATLRGIQIVTDPYSGAPTDYVAYGQIDALMVPTAGIANQVLALDPTSASAVAGTVTVPEGYTLASKELDLGCLRLVRDATAGSSFSYRAPAVPGVTLEVTAESATGSTTTGTSIAPGAGALSVVVPPAPQPSSPPDGGTLVDATTVFSWSGVPSAAYFSSFYNAASWFVVVVTPETSMTLPDWALLGAPLPKGASITWSLGSVAPQTMDEIVGRGTLAFPPDTSRGLSASRNLTTAP